MVFANNQWWWDPRKTDPEDWRNKTLRSGGSRYWDYFIVFKGVFQAKRGRSYQWITGEEGVTKFEETEVNIVRKIKEIPKHCNRVSQWKHKSLHRLQARQLWNCSLYLVTTKSAKNRMIFMC